MKRVWAIPAATLMAVMGAFVAPGLADRAERLQLSLAVETLSESAAQQLDQQLGAAVLADEIATPAIQMRHRSISSLTEQRSEPAPETSDNPLPAPPLVPKVQAEAQRSATTVTKPMVAPRVQPRAIPPVVAPVVSPAAPPEARTKPLNLSRDLIEDAQRALGRSPMPSPKLREAPAAATKRIVVDPLRRGERRGVKSSQKGKRRRSAYRRRDKQPRRENQPPMKGRGHGPAGEAPIIEGPVRLPPPPGVLPPPGPLPSPPPR